MRLVGTLSARQRLGGRLHGRTSLTGALSRSQGVFPEYAGPYEADALFSGQTFPTQAKTMARDFTVNAINYTEAPNEYGTTVTIGG